MQNNIVAWATAFRDVLDAWLGPQLVVALLGLVAFLTIAGVRKYIPEFWLYLEERGPEGKAWSRVWQSLPGVLITTGLEAVSSGLDPWAALRGALLGVALPFVHFIVKNYRGETGTHQPPSGSHRPPAPTQPNLLNLLVLGAALLMLSSCVPEARPPGRTQCYLDADKAALEAYVKQCKGHKTTRTCPEAKAIEAAHGEALEACP